MEAVLKILPQFAMSEADLNALNSLPNNSPETNLTKKQKELVSEMYSKFISRNKVYYGWGNELYELELKEKWPSGNRVKQHEAKRMVLGWLCTYNEYYSQLTGKAAIEFLLMSLNNREADCILKSKIYTAE